jgi:hypothetical protein
MPLNVRVDAAKAAIGYEKPKLNASEHNLRSSDQTIKAAGSVTANVRFRANLDIAPRAVNVAEVP